MPRHIALIPDGNRRWARARGQDSAAGHAAGIAQVGAVTQAAWAAGTETLSFWWGSPASPVDEEHCECCGGEVAARSTLAEVGRVVRTSGAGGDLEQALPAILDGVDPTYWAALKEWIRIANSDCLEGIYERYVPDVPRPDNELDPGVVTEPVEWAPWWTSD